VLETRVSVGAEPLLQLEQPLLRLDEVRKHFPVSSRLPWSPLRGHVRAVDGVSLAIRAHETLSVVGESGCGKTTMARLVLRLDEPTGGRILFQGEDLRGLRGPALRRYRASIQAVFQDPWSSLNPRMRAAAIVAEPIVLNRRPGRKELADTVAELLLAVGLEPSAATSFPHEFSGGMRQRLAVARALAIRPSLIVLDEPVSALDVSIRAQIMNLLRDLQVRFGMAYLLIAHDLATVRYLSDYVAVMYLGQIVEHGPAEEVFTRPLHPYTRALLSAALPVRPGEREEILLEGEPPSPISPPPGCRFHPRCPFVFARCREEPPALAERAPGHLVACHLY
jgi:oligopeptide/dipeptide ABC transporter ATP-binding protein